MLAFSRPLTFTVKLRQFVMRFNAAIAISMTSSARVHIGSGANHGPQTDMRKLAVTKTTNHTYTYAPSGPKPLCVPQQPAFSWRQIEGFTFSFDSCLRHRFAVKGVRAIKTMAVSSLLQEYTSLARR